MFKTVETTVDFRRSLPTQTPPHQTQEKKSLRYEDMKCETNIDSQWKITCLCVPTSYNRQTGLQKRSVVWTSHPPGLERLLSQETGRENHHRSLTPWTWLMWTSPIWQAQQITVCQNKQREQTQEPSHSTGHHTHQHSAMWYSEQTQELAWRTLTSHDLLNWPTASNLPKYWNKNVLQLRQLLWTNKNPGTGCCNLQNKTLTHERTVWFNVFCAFTLKPPLTLLVVLFF